MASTPNQETTLLIKYLEDSSQSLWTIKKSNLGGRGLYATQTIQNGSLIFTNKPLVVVPRDDSVQRLVCSICYKFCDSCFTCEKCSSITCCENCKISQQHHLECDFITNNWKAKSECGELRDVLKSAHIYIRFLLLVKHHKSLLSILQTCTIKSKVEDIEKLCSVFVIPEDQIRFMEFVHCIMKLNSFRIANSPQSKKAPLRGLYPLSSFLNHSCIPNTRNVFKEDYSMSIYATNDIEIGEEILTCYTGLLWCTPARRYQLFKSKEFWCKCARCEDRTELGTTLSALKCFNKDCVGILLPKSPLNLNIEWTCDNCNSIYPASKISTVQSVLGSLVGSLDLDDQFRLEPQLLARLANFVPYTNHIFIDIRLRLAQRLGFTGLKLNGIYWIRIIYIVSIVTNTKAVCQLVILA